MTPFDESAAVEAMAKALTHFFSSADRAYGEHKEAAQAALSALRPFLEDGWRTIESAPKVPSLREWLGDGARAEGFEEWVATMLAAEQSSVPGANASMRIVGPLMIAMVESARLADADGQDPVDTIMRMGRGCGYAFLAAMTGKADEGMPLDEALEMASQLFREGAELFIQHESEAPPPDSGKEG